MLSGGGRFAVGDRARYSCVPGYVLDGHATLSCITNAGNIAVWDFPAPICRGMDDYVFYICVYVFMHITVCEDFHSEVKINCEIMKKKI